MLKTPVKYIVMSVIKIYIFALENKRGD